MRSASRTAIARDQNDVLACLPIRTAIRAILLTTLKVIIGGNRACG